MEVGSRKLLHFDVTAHPTAECTLQQFRETIPWYRFVIMDRRAKKDQETTTITDFVKVDQRFVVDYLEIDGKFTAKEMRRVD